MLFVVLFNDEVDKNETTSQAFPFCAAPEEEPVTSCVECTVGAPGNEKSEWGGAPMAAFSLPDALRILNQHARCSLPGIAPKSTTNHEN